MNTNASKTHLYDGNGARKAQSGVGLLRTTVYVIGPRSCRRLVLLDDRPFTIATTELVVPPGRQRLGVTQNIVMWVRKVARVNRADRRRMVELREETGVQRSLRERDW